MNDIEIDQLADSWIAEWEVGDQIVRNPDDPCSHDKVSDLTFDDDHETLWKFILAAYSKDMSSRVFAVLAAGPLEDLLANFGTEYIDRIEKFARQDAQFNELLGGVWKRSIPDDVWERVISVRNRVW